MKLLKSVFDCYLNASIHIGFAVLALAQTTVLILKIPKIETNVLSFIFFGTIVFYNIMKYSHLKNNFLRVIYWKQILFISILSFCLQIFYFFQINFLIQMQFLCIGILACVYPFIRKIKFLKMFFVALCITAVTAFIPIETSQSSANIFLLFFVSRFLWLFCLLLPFEIRDFNLDKKTIKTIPHQFGIHKTKVLGYFLLLIPTIINADFKITAILFLTAIAIYLSDKIASKYFVSFWVESIPIFAYFLYLTK